MNLKKQGFLKKDIEELPISELIEQMRTWCCAQIGL